MDSKINIKKIAELANVSTATVSRVINQNGRFSAETEARVRKVIEEYTYTPNMVAKGLRTNKLPVVGAILPDVQNSHFASLIVNIEVALHKEGYSLIICNTNEDENLEKSHLQTLIAQNVSGIFIISGHGDYEVPANIPVVYLDRRPEHSSTKKSIVVESDNEAGGYLATKKLIESGCRNIATLQSINMDQNQRDRYTGYCRALKEAGLSMRQELVFSAEDTSPENSAAVVNEKVRQNIAFDGIMCATDTMAIGACSALQQLNIKIPEDVCLTGFDDAPITKFFYPSITTIRQHVDEMALQAVDLLIARMYSKAPSSHRCIVPVELIERSSTR